MGHRTPPEAVTCRQLQGRPGSAPGPPLLHGLSPGAALSGSTASAGHGGGGWRSGTCRSSWPPRLQRPWRTGGGTQPGHAFPRGRSAIKAAARRRRALVARTRQRLRRSPAMEGVLYSGLPREAAEELRLQPQGSEEAKAFVSAFLKRSMPKKKDEAIQDVLTRKAVVLEHHCRRRKKPKRKKTKTFTAKQRRELRLFEIEPEQQRYEIFLPLHELWKQYIRDLCYGLKPDAQPQMVQSKLLKADLHGAIVTVTKSKCPSYVGITGIILQEFKHVFKIITKDNKLKVVPKINNVFSLETDGFISYIYGSKFQLRASERSAKKFKLKGTIDL